MYWNNFRVIEHLSSNREAFKIHYAEYDSPFGTIVIGSANGAVCYIGLDKIEDAESILSKRFKSSSINYKRDEFQKLAAKFLNEVHTKQIKTLPLLLYGTSFQISVWKALLEIPLAQLVSYSDIAEIVGKPKGTRAIGTAVGCNPITYLVPCHRVLRRNGTLGSYFWGLEKKREILQLEKRKDYTL